MPSVWETRWSAFVRRALALRESTALEALPDLMPVLVVNDPDAPEGHLLRHDRMCHGRVSEAAVAGQFGRLAIKNPLGSGKIVVVERAQLTGGFGNITIGYFPFSDIAGSVNEVKDVADFRSLGAAAPPTAILRHDTNAVGASLPTQVFLTANSDIGVMDRPFVLPPGTSLAFVHSAVNLPVQVSLRWRERSVDPGELTPGA